MSSSALTQVSAKAVAASVIVFDPQAVCAEGAALDHVSELLDVLESSLPPDYWEVISWG